MTATNYTIFRPKHVDGIKFGDTAWSTADFSSAAAALDTVFTANNASPLFDAVGTRDANDPVQSEAFAKNITFSGNERSTTENNLLGSDANGTQNQEIDISATSLQEVTLTLVYRNNVPFSIFNDTTTCCIMEVDNSEGATSGIANFGFNNITMLSVGSLTMNEDGMMEQTLKFSHKGGTTGSVIAVTQASGSEAWSKVVGGDYAEEVRLS